MKHKTALKGFIGTDWAVEETWLKNAAQVIVLGDKGEIPSRDDASFLAEYGERPEGCKYTVVSGSKAIVDIYGAIIPRANFFSEWCGGASCQLLQKDIVWIRDNEAIEEVLFVIHSPGGEVTSVSETANLILQLRETKTVTAYISGMGCSAAYWLASACSKIYVNETAIVGSIGVMSVYVDDSRQLEMVGLEEIEFISSQSPMKNADPKSDKGKTAIQSRVNSLAQVFVENIAVNMGVSVETVLKDFGQGGVFIGAEAVKAGLAHQVGNFADAVTQINSELEQSDLPTENKGETMAEKQEAATVAAEKSEFEQMKQTIAELQKADTDNKTALEALQSKNSTLEKEKLTNELNEVSKDWHGAKENHLVVLDGLITAFGKDSPQFKAYVETQNGLSKQLEAASIFDEAGGKGGEEKSAFEQLTEKAKVIQLASNIPFENAFAKATEQNQALYAQYRKEND